jgi:hypothetical protein
LRPSGSEGALWGESDRPSGVADEIKCLLHSLCSQTPDNLDGEGCDELAAEFDGLIEKKFASPKMLFMRDISELDLLHPLKYIEIIPM